MAETTLGIFGIAGTVGAAQLTAASGFVGRHEHSHREEIMETRRNMNDFRANLQSGDVTPDEEREFLRIREDAIRWQNEYHESIGSYKEVSWTDIRKKLKQRKAVRQGKRLTRQANHTLRNLNEAMSSGSDTSSITASSGSPPGSNLAGDDIEDWASAVRDADSVDGTEAYTPADDSRNEWDGNQSGNELVLREIAAGTLRNLTKCSVSHVPQIIEMLEHGNWVARHSAANALGKLSDHSVFRNAIAVGIPRVTEMLEHSDARVRHSASNALEILALHPLIHFALVPEIPRIMAMRECHDSNARGCAANLLDIFAAYPPINEALIPCIPRIIGMLGSTDLDLDVRLSGAKTLRTWAKHPVFCDALTLEIPRIIELLWYSIDDCAVSVLQELAYYPAFHDALSLGIPRIVELLGKIDGGVRGRAAGVLEKWAHYPAFQDVLTLATPHIIELLQHKNRSIRKSAGRVFGKLADHIELHESLALGTCYLVEMLIGHDWDVRNFAADTLRKVADHDGFHDALAAHIPRLIEMLKDNAYHMHVRHVAEVFGKLAGNPTYHDALILEIPRILEMLNTIRVGSIAARELRSLRKFMEQMGYKENLFAKFV